MRSPPEKPKRIAFLLPSLDGGGAERVYADIANQFVKWDLTVDMILARRQGVHLTRLDERIQVTNLAIRFKHQSVTALARHLRRTSPEILLSAMDVMNVVALTARALSGVNPAVVVTSHMPWSGQTTGDTRFHRRALVPLARLLYGRADGLIAVSSGVADELAATIGIKRSRVSVVPNPVDVESIHESGRSPAGHAWVSPYNAPFLLSVGRLAKEKDFPTLLHAFARVREEQGLRLIILGEGPERPALERLVEELGLSGSVSLPGFVENPFPYMKSAAALVLSSCWEGFGLVLVEAMACGCQVISTDCPSGPAEILDHGRFGRLVPVGDPEALAAAVEETLCSPLDPALLRLRAEDFRLETIAAQYLEILEEAAARVHQP
jgi:glycosyltransferase involved in cell wall biosynthesis